MRKITLVLSTLVFISMLLVACGGQETSTSMPSTDLPPMTEEPTMEATEAVPAGTETGAPTEQGTPVGGIPVTGEEGPSRLSNQLDYTVWNQNGEQIGEVNDMVVDLNDSQVSYVIVGTGGFLEIGEKDIFVPWDSLQLQTEAGDMTGGEQYAFILRTDQEIFNNAPDIDVNAILPALGEPTNDWDIDIRNYWEGGVVPGTQSAGTAMPETTGTASLDATATPDESGTTTAALQGVVLASELLGSDISVGSMGEITENGDQAQTQAVGTGTPEATTMPSTTTTPDTGTAGDEQDQVTTATIDDVIVNVDTGDVMYIVISSSFDDGDRWIPIPLSSFQWEANAGAFILNTDQAMLQDAPFFADGQYPDTTVDGWDSDYSSYWQ
jgi:sporulation protein YlmC with PRC-barrel domain